MFRSRDGLEHSVEVVADPLSEAAEMLSAFRSSTFAGRVSAGTTDRLRVSVKLEEVQHEVRVSDLEAWLACVGKSPPEQALKFRLRQRLALRIPERSR